MFNLEGKKALVTGSTQGIGLAIAKTLSEYGATVFIHCGSSEEKAKNISSEIKNSYPVCVNLLEEDAAEKLYAATGDVDIVILNASVQIKKKWDEITEEDMYKQFDINVKSTFQLIQKYVPKMKENSWGRIITVGSVQQYKPHKEMAFYAATKSANMNIVTNLASQLAPFGITVNNIAPGVIATPRNEDALNDDKYRDIVLSKIPAGYAGESYDIAGGALLLSSDAGRYITGTDLIIDGGMHL
ncbi:MAG: SDR family oxidoreductase [Clostridia bacterium]|nr:SDR family oxidoreductase [Clostridia bacterium]